MRPETEALIVIDVQNDFCPGGALAVAGGDQIIPRINALMDEFQTVVLTQDWHPANHASFAANHAGAAPFSLTEMPYGPQVLWPVHCVQGTPGAAFHPDLRTDPAQLVIRKGFRPGIDSYSAFFENDRRTATGGSRGWFWSGWRPITVWPIRPWMPRGWALRRRCWRGPAAPSTLTAALPARGARRLPPVWSGLGDGHLWLSIPA